MKRKFRFVVSYFANRMPEHFGQDLDEMKRGGCNEILLTYSENDMEFYAGMMKQFVSMAREKGFETYAGPWSLGGVFGGAYSKYVALHVDEREVLNNGDRPPAACLNNPHFRLFFRDWIHSAIDCGFDSIFFDEPHFFMPGWGNLYKAEQQDIWGCRCPFCRKLYQKVNGSEMPLNSPTGAKVQADEHPGLFDLGL